jgi:hypothetical protein
MRIAENFFSKKQLLSSIDDAFGYAFFLALSFGEASGGVRVLVKNSSTTELILCGAGFFALSYVFVLIFKWQLLIAKMFSELYCRLIVVAICIAFLVFASESLPLYWNSLHNNSAGWSKVFSGLFFTPIFVLATVICHLIALWVREGGKVDHKIDHLVHKVASQKLNELPGSVDGEDALKSIILNEIIRDFDRKINDCRDNLKMDFREALIDDVREIVNDHIHKLRLGGDGLKACIKEEIQAMLYNNKQYAHSKIYDKNNVLVGTNFYYQIEDGYWLNVITREGKNGFGFMLAEHFQTHQHFEGKGSEASVKQHIFVNQTEVFGTKSRGDTPAGIIFPR